MKDRSLHRNSYRPAGHLLLACCAALSFAPSAFAACTPSATVTCLADQPIQSANIVKPNVMFILDNSGSMASDYMPDTASSSNYCRKNYQYNTVYYNPNYNYTANIPKNAMNVTMTSQTFTNAAKDPFASTVSYVNLSTAFCAQGGEAGTCSSGPATTSTNAQPGYYYKYTAAGSPGTSCSANGNYTKVVVSATSCAVSGDVTNCPTGADERVNFANWYSYFRTRRLMMRSGIASAFAPLDDKFRIGFYTINSPTATAPFTNGAALNIDDFSGGGAGTPKGNWYERLFKAGGNSSTPLQTALDRIGQYYSGTAPTALSGDPIQYSCQKNFAILSTDGYWNGTPPTRGNWDRTVPASMPIKEGNSVYNSADTAGSYGTPLVEGATFPKPYYEGSTVTNNTLADIAMYYWVRDLRTAGIRSPNNVPTTATDLDPAYWQHMTTYTVGLGVDGTLSFPSQLPTAASGTNWPVPVANAATTIDDLWHAAINGHGNYYSAKDPATLSNSLTAALRSISNTSSFGVGPASSTADFKSPDQTDFTTYASSYRIINWSGDVTKYAINPTTGLKTGAALWSAAKQLDSKVNPGLTSTVNTTAYLTRNIVTRTEAGTPVEFSYTTISPTQQTALCYKVSPGTGPCIVSPPASATDSASLVNYLRGDPTFEGDYAMGISRFRNRHDITESTYYRRDLIGTIVNAKPAYVATERFTYQESADPGYEAFKAANLSRSPTLYVPANDGMVHAINAANGEELWAYVPSLIIPTGLDDNGKERGLRALSYQDGGGPAYNHHFYVDATPEVGAVDFDRVGGPITASSPSGAWRTILVGGLGKGGKGYYALDVTAPANSLSSAKSKVLWEFPSPSDSTHVPVIAGGWMGHSVGQAFIGKTHAYGWVVLVPSGYNNSDGNGYVFVLNAKTGALLEYLKTPSAAPGMAHITTLVKANNKFITQVYSGDLNGSLWRFDFGQTPLSPRVEKLFTSSATTPIASEVNASVDPNNGDRWIFLGTGQYLDVPDRGTTTPQYLVALRDGSATVPKITGWPVSLASLSTVTSLTSGVASAPLGWNYQLPTAGERIALKPIADLRTVMFGSLIPTTDPCSPGVSGYAYGLEYDTGASRLMVSGSIVPHVYFSAGVAGMEIIRTDDRSGASTGVVARISSNDGQSVTVNLDIRKINSGTRHVGWRELINEY